ncbi:Calmodulin regulated spectrin associated protein [Trichuris trichiura]|uniref:Calmodulin regulated spectrin associated protein n=1 Tax=Trichuris trichiura TaxID=36087 RepID=A0A077Z314_TRITR|nr:Calmodulin regulated spectrin associated protein [Trichuris trichiura]
MQLLLGVFKYVFQSSRYLQLNVKLRLKFVASAIMDAAVGQRGFFGKNDLLIEPVIDVLPMSEYNAAEAKLRSSVKWLLARAFGEGLPEEFVDPFYVSEDNHAQLRPTVVNAMATGELYGLAASSIFHDELFASDGHKAILQTLQRYVGQVIDSDGNAVTETALCQTTPLRVNSHLAMIDHLMAAMTKDVVSGQAVLTACKKQGPIRENDLPPDNSEGALLYWINKVCECVRDRVETSIATNCGDAPIIPEMDDVYEDICDGACVATVISYYHPEKLKFDDICFNDPMSLTDCIHNLWLIKEFCAKHLPCNVFHFTYEDVLYTHETLKPNLNAFLAELFYFFEGSLAGKLHSRINSIDSLMTDRSVDSLKYRHFGTASGRKLYRSEVDVGNSRPPGTVSFLDISAETNNASLSSFVGKTPPSYTRSETMPSVKLHSTPSLIRMQLEEKRRLYEAQRQKRHTELTEQRQKLSKAAFFQLKGKEISNSDNSSPSVNQEQHSIEPAKKPSPSAPAEFVEISKNIKEMQEQMKRLSMEQEKLQQLVKSKQESTTAMFSPVAASVTPLFNAQSLICLPSSAFPQMCPSSSVGEVAVQSPVDDSRQDGVAPIDDQSFMLHANGKRVSRLDPPLEFSNNISNWGMTCSVNRPPRRTWQSLSNTQNGAQYAASMVDLPACREAYEEEKAQLAENFQSVSKDAEDNVSCRLEEKSTDGNISMNGVLEEKATATDDGHRRTSAVAPFEAVADKERDSSPGIGFVIAAESQKLNEEELLRRKEQKFARVLRRREEMELRRAKVEEENAQRRAKLMQRMEEEERRKREKELRRQRVLEEYQKRKAEQEAMEQSSSSFGTLPNVTPRSRLTRNQSQPPVRPKSQMMSSSRTALQTDASSVGNIDKLMDSCVSEPGLSEPALKLYVKPVQKSNRTIVYNAIQHNVLVGSVNVDVKRKVLEELAKSDGKHFLLLFRDQKCQFRGLYCWDQTSDTVHKLYGVGPKSCTESMMNLLFKYDSGAKQFSYIPSKHLSATIDAFTIKDDFWQRKQSSLTPRR